MMKVPKWLRIRRRSQNAITGKSCGCTSIAECPYTSVSDCKFDKVTCHLLESMKQRKTEKSTIGRIIIFIVLGLLFYTLSVIAAATEEFSFKYSEQIYHVFGAVFLSLISGSILAIVIDIPSKLKDYESSFISALASNSYLKSLSEERLTSLRNDVTEQLHKAKAPCMAKGLINIDQKVLDLLRQPYYTRYRQSVVCKKIADNTNYIQKEHNVEYKLINPYSVNKEATEYIYFTNLVKIEAPSEGQDMPSAINNLKISYKKDDEDIVVLVQNEDFVLKSELLSQPKTEYYNARIWLEPQNRKPSDLKPGIRVDFKDNLIVRLDYTIDVHVNDVCFTKRLQHPAKNFRLDYSCKDIEGHLFGQIFGTQLKQSEFSIKYLSENSISLEAFDWLLPDNGAIVVLNTAKLV